MEAQSDNLTLMARKSSFNSESTCLVCCNQSDIFALPPCNHKHVCWKCCLNLTENNKFCCPFCKEDIKGKDKIVLIHVSKMSKNYNQIIQQGKIYKSQKNALYYYASPQVAEVIQRQTSLICAVCQQNFQSQNILKKHLNQKHRKQYCDICLANRKCILSEHIIYNQVQLNTHLKKGQYSPEGELILFHPHCDLCGINFYDIEQFRKHLDRDHWKCTICYANFQELRAVYYKDYDQIQIHFKKSHFMCEIGQCLNKKLENVFISQAVLQQHIQRCHKKSKINKNQPVMNLLLGFHKNEEQDGLKWDKIGKNFINIFNMFDKHKGIVQKVNHYDAKIDIRQFYSALTKPTLNWGLDKVKKELIEKINEFGYKPQIVYLNDIKLFRPLEMQSASRSQLQKFLHLIFDSKTANIISQNFFTKKHEFKSNDQYFQFIKKQMKYYSSFAYYYAFPQLIRFFKNQNPTKFQMDEYYYVSLRELKIAKQFIIHTKERYSEVLEYMQYFIKKQAMQRIGEQISLEDYKTYLKQMNANFYLKNQEKMFFISKQRISTLYHMIDKCKTQDFLKMNWLLKVGFSGDAYKVIQKQIYYKTQDQCYKAMKKFDTQQLAFLYSYIKICLEAIFDSLNFNNNKKSPTPCFLRPILDDCKEISHIQKKQIIEMQNNSLKIELHFKQNRNKGVIINQADHPSLLEINCDPPSRIKPPPDRDRQDFPILGEFGSTRRPKKWNQQSSKLKINKVQHEQEYPSILSKNQKKNTKNFKQEQQDFPVFNLKDQKSNKKKKSNNTIHDMIGWGTKQFVPNQWNQQESLKNWAKRQQAQKIRIQRQKQKQKSNQFSNKNKNQKQQFSKDLNNKKKSVIGQREYISRQEEEDMDRAIKESLKKEQQLVVIKSKKQNLIDQQQNGFNKKGKKHKKNKDESRKINQQELQKQSKSIQNESIKKKTQDVGIFEQIQKQQKLITQKRVAQVEKQIKKKQEEEKKKVKKPKMRFDDTSQEEQPKSNNISVIDEDDFAPIGSHIQKNQKKSIVNSISEAHWKQEIQPQVKVKKNRKGKTVIIQKVNLF